MNGNGISPATVICHWWSSSYRRRSSVPGRPPVSVGSLVNAECGRRPPRPAERPLVWVALVGQSPEGRPASRTVAFSLNQSPGCSHVPGLATPFVPKVRFAPPTYRESGSPAVHGLQCSSPPVLPPVLGWGRMSVIGRCGSRNGLLHRRSTECLELPSTGRHRGHSNGRMVVWPSVLRSAPSGLVVRMSFSQCPNGTGRPVIRLARPSSSEWHRSS